MADLSKIKLPNNTTYDIKDAKKSGVYNVIGTQTSSTENWTGTINIPALYDGLTIDYFLPYNGVSSTSVTLNLTLSNGTTTGAKNVYYGGSTRLTTHYGAGTSIKMTYYSAGSISISGTATTDDRWIADADYNADVKVRQTKIATNYNLPLLMSYAQASSETANIDNVTYRNNSIFANPSTGRITTKNLTVGISADNATFPDGAIRCYDVRNVTGVPTTEGVNFIMTNEGSPINTNWYSGLYVKSSGGEYGAWELIGPAYQTDNRTKPFYVRASNKTTAWGSWRKIYDSSNPPNASDVGALSSATVTNGVLTIS